ncbi:MAG: T9SS type A sorting domain-containing protein, partial [Cryomorphaceae bacterium]
ENTFGGSLFDRFRSLVLADDGGFVMAGETDSNDGDIDDNNGLYDMWLVKTDSEGNLEWSQTYGSSSIDRASVLKKHADGGYIMAGSALAGNGDVSELTGIRDIWVVWTDEDGNILQNKTYGNESSYSLGYDLYGPVNGGNWILTGTIADLLNDNSSGDTWIAEIDGFGEVIWSVASGGNGEDADSRVLPTENGYLISGSTDSEDGDLEFQTNAGSRDLWVYNLEITVNTRDLSDPSIVVFPNPTEQVLRVAGMDAVREIRLFEMGGKTVKTVANQNHMNISELSPGTYTAEFRNENTVVTRKIVIR